jgi:hypothetical protein
MSGGQSGFWDVQDRLRELSVQGDPLEKLAATVDFEIWTPPESLASGAHRAPDDRWDAPIAGESAVAPALA